MVLQGLSLGKDALTGRRELIGKLDAGLVKPSAAVLTVNELLDLYLNGLDADQRLSPKKSKTSPMKSGGRSWRHLLKHERRSSAGRRRGHHGHQLAIRRATESARWPLTALLNELGCVNN